MKQISPHIWTWSEFNQERQMNFNGWYLQFEDETVLIDPPTPNDNVTQFIKARGAPDSILLTNRHHTRASEFFREAYDCPIWIHEQDEGMMEIAADRTFDQGDVLSCGLRVLHLNHGKTKGESAFIFSNKPSAIFVGDAVIGHPQGSLSMLSPDKFADPLQAKLEVNRLLEFPFDLLLLGDGEPILKDGYNILRNFLTQA